MKEIDVTEDIFRLFRKMVSEIEGLKSLMLEDENRGKEDVFDPFKRIVLSPEGYKRFKEIDEAPLTEEKKKAIEKFVEETNEFYGTTEDKERIHEKCGTNTPPKTNPISTNESKCVKSNDKCFSAQRAYDMTRSTNSDIPVYKRIKEATEQGFYKTTSYLTPEEKKELLALGYTVEFLVTVAGKNRYIIRWDK